MDDFNFDSLDLGRTWSPPTYIATAPPIVCRDKNQSQRRYDTVKTRLLMMSHSCRDCFIALRHVTFRFKSHRSKYQSPLRLIWVDV